MPEYTLTQRAARDLAEIADYTIQMYGVAQSRAYRDALHDCFTLLVETPRLGRSAEYIDPQLRCFAHQSHVIFYRPENHGILIVRVLHSSMDVLRHL